MDSNLKDSLQRLNEVGITICVVAAALIAFMLMTGHAIWLGFWRPEWAEKIPHAAKRPGAATAARRALGGVRQPI